MTARAISLPLSRFIYRLSEPKPIEKWSTFIKINEESFSNLKKRFVIDGYGGFQDKARECGIEKLNFSFGVKHKEPEPPDFPNGRLFTVSSEDEWQIYQDFLFGENGKEYELVGKFSRFCISSKKVLFCSIYWPDPGNDTGCWLEKFNIFLDHASETYENMVIGGDLNLSKIPWDSLENTSGTKEVAFLEILNDHFLTQLNFIPTRHDRVSDLVITNVPDRVRVLEVLMSSVI